MRKIILLFLFFLILPIAYAATTENTPQVFETKINISIKGYMDGNVSKVNLTVFTEDDILNYNALSSSSNIFETYEIDFIRTLQCPLSNVEDLQSTIKTYFENQECGEKSCAVRWTECKEAGARAEVTKNMQDAVLAGFMIEGNYNISDCSTEKNTLSTKNQQLLNEKTELEKMQKDNSSNKWILTIGGLIVGAFGYWGLGDSLRKDKSKNAPHEKNYPQLRESEKPSSRLDDTLERLKNMPGRKSAPPEEELEETYDEKPVRNIPFKKEAKRRETAEERAARITKELEELDKEDA